MNKVSILFLLLCGTGIAVDEPFLRWDAKTAKDIILAHRVTGQVGKSFDLRITSTDKSFNFKLRATWFTPEVIQATARLHQMANALNDPGTRALVSEAICRGRYHRID